MRPEPGERRLRETVDAFGRCMLTLPRSSAAPAAWGPREVLAHIAYWHERYVSIIQAALKNREPRLLEGSFRDLNARAVEAMASESIPQMVLRLNKAQDQLERLAPQARQRRIRVANKNGAMRRTVDELLARVESHIQAHHAAIRRELRKAA